MIAVGVLIMLVGFVPLLASGFTVAALEGAATFFATGLLIFLVGTMLRKLRKSFE